VVFRESRVWGNAILDENGGMDEKGGRFFVFLGIRHENDQNLALDQEIAKNAKKRTFCRKHDEVSGKWEKCRNLTIFRGRKV